MVDEEQVMISVIIPVYNAEKYLHKCIDSVLSQSYQDFELILVNDGSKDLSGSICDEYARKDERVKVFHKENGGVSTARNIGIDNATGDYICFVDSDDWIESNCLEVLHKTVLSENLDILQFSYRRVNEDEEIIQTYSEETLILDLYNYIEKDVFLVCVAGTIVKKSIIEKNNLRFQTNLKLAEDQLFILSAMNFSKRLKRISNVFYNYRKNEKSATATAEFYDIVHSIVELNNFKHKKTFKKHIDRMIVLQTNSALNVRNSDILFLFKETRNITIDPKIHETRNANMKLLIYSWNKFLLFAYILVRINYYRRRIL